MAVSAFVRIIVCALVCTAAIAVDTPLIFRDRGEEARFKALAMELRCLVCQNQSIDESHAPLAQDLRNEVLRLMREGRSDRDIKNHLRQRYGDFVLYRTPMRPATYVLWFGPVLLLCAALTLALWRWRRLHRTRDSPLTEEERTHALATLTEISSAPQSNRP